MKETIRIRIGHLAMLQTDTKVDPRPIKLPTFSASGPVKTIASEVIVSRTSRTTVTPRRTGSFFQIGRPSSTSQTLLEASMNAPMYPEADQIAAARPMISATVEPPLLDSRL